MPFYRVNPFGQGSPFGIIGEPYTYNNPLAELI